VLLTSQEALNMHEERVYRLDALEVPEPEASLEVARGTGAVALLVDRASAADQHFRLNEANLAQIIDICRQLSGLPLAIELAAARLRTLGVEGLRDRLGDRLDLLTGGARELPARHRTLRAALEWSYALLSPPEQQVFRRLGVMQGRFDLAAVQSVTADTGLDQWSLLDALDGLCSKSLLLTTTTADGETRFQFLETMRHFALDRLRAAGEESAARDRHFSHFLGLAEAASEFLSGPQQGKWLVRLDQDRDNLFAAHRHCDAMPNGVAQGLRLALALIRYWMNRGTLLQGQQVIEEALARPGVEQHNILYATGLMHSGRLYAFRGMDREARAQYERAIAIGRECGATAAVAESLGRMGYALIGLNDRVAARAALQEARDLAALLPAHEWRPRTVAFSNLAELERLEGHYKVASPLYEQALALNVNLGDRQATMIALNNLAMMALALGNLDAVRQRCLESLAICNELDSRRGRLVVMEVCSGMAGVLGQSAEAVFFDASARRHTHEMGRRRDVVDDAFLAPRIDRARQSLGANGCVAEEAKASSADYAMAVARMTDWLECLPASGVAGSVQLTEDATVTSREKEIASLIARGYSNGDIAQLLEISVLTVRTHRQRLMDKLELRNAAEITAYAVRMGWFNPN
jgi:predicted ATPase/DNA-binding CsgD family transcriptional regulator